MSDYDMTFAKKLLSDEDFDTIFGAEEDDRLMSALKEEADEFIKDDPDTDGIEDGLGDLGKGTGLGSDLGTDHETKGADGAKNDTSDEDVLAKQAGETFSKGDQLNTGDNAQGQVKDGSQVSGDLRVAGDDDKSSDDSFKESAEEDLEVDESEEDDMIDAADAANEEGDASDEVVNSLIKDEDGDEEDILDLL